MAESEAPPPSSPASGTPASASTSVLDLAERPAAIFRLTRQQLVSLRLQNGAVGTLLAFALAGFAVLVVWGGIVVLGRSVDDAALAGLVGLGPGAALVASCFLAAAIVRRTRPRDPDEVLLFPDRVEAFAGGSGVERFFFRQLDEVEVQAGPRGELHQVTLRAEKGRELALARPWPLGTVVEHLERLAVPAVVARHRGLLELGDTPELRAVGRFQEERLRRETFSGLYFYAASLLFLARYLVELGRHEIAPFDTLDLPFFFVFASFGLGLRWEGKRGLRAPALVLSRAGVRAASERPEDARPWRELTVSRAREGLRLEAPGRAPLVYEARGSSFRFMAPVLEELARTLAVEPAATASA